MGGHAIFLAVRTRIGRAQVQNNAYRALVAQRPELLHRFGMGQHAVISHRDCPFKINHARIMQVVQIARFDRHNRLVKSKPMSDPIAEQAETGFGIAGIGFHHRPAFPAAFSLHAHRHVEMVKVDKWRNALSQQAIDKRVIESDGFRIHLALPVRDQP
ncbi:hypothetical protein D3C71_1710540 [compost metagenome]